MHKLLRVHGINILKIWDEEFYLEAVGSILYYTYKSKTIEGIAIGSERLI